MKKWYCYRFRIKWSDVSREPSWWVGIALFDSVIKQILEKRQSKVSLWRIHRRAINDDKGHQFTFWACCQPRVSKSIDKIITSNYMVSKLRKEEVIANYSWREGKPEEITDRNWPIEIQKSWPHFIMGASETLLALIEHIRENEPFLNACNSMEEIRDYYVNLNKKLCYVWKIYGSHAFFHHMNALFGYAPILTQPKLIAWF